MNQAHIELPPIPLTKEKHEGKSYKYFAKLELRRDPTLPALDLYEFKFVLFDNGKSEEFLLFICKLNMNLVASGTLEAGAKYQYLFLLYAEKHCVNLTHCLPM